MGFSAKTVKRGQVARGSNLKCRAGAVSSALLGYSVEVSVAGFSEGGGRIFSIGTVGLTAKAVKRFIFTSRAYFENRSAAIDSIKAGRAIKIAVCALDQRTRAVALIDIEAEQRRVSLSRRGDRGYQTEGEREENCGR